MRSFPAAATTRTLSVMPALDAVSLAVLREMCATGEARELRLAARLSLGEVAQAIDAGHATTILRWETGERSPHGPVALRYLSLLRGLAAAMPTKAER